MLKLILFLCFAALLSPVSAWFFGKRPDNNNLKVTWDMNPFNSYRFAAMPRTADDARRKGWILVEDDKKCDEGFFLGQRYFKYDKNIQADDTAVMLIFDANGYIAGIQTGIPDSDTYPSKDIENYFVWEPARRIHTITAYFVDPSIICTGRSQADFNRDGTGDRVVIRYGKAEPTYMTLPATISDLPGPGQKWTRGKCFYTMGLHYWYNVTREMSCDEFVPIFLLYNGDRLNSFGWAFQGGFESKRFEHPPVSALGMFLPDERPDCLTDGRPLSTLHIFLTNNPSFNFC